MKLLIYFLKRHSPVLIIIKNTSILQNIITWFNPGCKPVIAILVQNFLPHDQFIFVYSEIYFVNMPLPE